MYVAASIFRIDVRPFSGMSHRRPLPCNAIKENIKQIYMLFVLKRRIDRVNFIDQTINDSPFSIPPVIFHLIQAIYVSLLRISPPFVTVQPPISFDAWSAIELVCVKQSYDLL